MFSVDLYDKSLHQERHTKNRWNTVAENYGDGKEGASTSDELEHLWHKPLVDCFNILGEPVHDPTDRLAFKPPHWSI